MTHKNLHVYKAFVTQKLPPGRYLQLGENIQSTDIFCPDTEPFQTVSSYWNINCISRWSVGDRELNKYYRPDVA